MIVPFCATPHVAVPLSVLRHLYLCDFSPVFTLHGSVCCVGPRRQLIGAVTTISPCPIDICRLLQSHGDRMRFYPAWNATALGRASFTTLRAYGAFLVSASVDAHGTVSAVSLASEVGGDVVFDSPWPGSAPTVVNSKGAAVSINKVSAGVYSFGTVAGVSYRVGIEGRVVEGTIASGKSW